MKTLKLLIGISLLLILTNLSVSAQERLEKNLNEEFSITKGASLEVYSKFGDVEVSNWESDKVEVNVEIWVESNNISTTEELFNKLDAEISQTGNIVSVKSILPDKLNTGKNTKFKINIYINAPKYININLESKYGSVFIDENNGKVMLNIDYGNINIEKLSRGKEKPLNEIILRYSKANIEEVDWLKANLSYSKLSVEEAKAIVLISKYSGLSIEECSSIVTDSKYDTYRFEELNNFIGHLNYSNVKIEKLNKKIESESNYSSFKIAEMDADFELIKIDNSRGSYSINLDESSSFSIKADAVRGSISIPDINISTKRSDNTKKYFEGNYGDNPESVIEVISKEGSVKFNFD